MPIINFVLQGKGGVGKSLIASVLTSYYQSIKIDYLAIDTDPVNQTLSKFNSLNINQYPVMTDDYIDPRKFDKFLNLIIDNKKTTIVDIGSNSFVNFCSYLLSNDTLTLLNQLEFTINIHTIIAGGQNLYDTSNGFVAIARQFPETTRIIVWINPFFGDIYYDNNKSFRESKLFNNSKDKVKAIITIPKLKKDLHETDFQFLLSKGLSLNEINNLDEYGYGVIEKHRLGVVRDKFYGPLKEINNLLLD